MGAVSYVETYYCFGSLEQVFVCLIISSSEQPFVHVVLGTLLVCQIIMFYKNWVKFGPSKTYPLSNRVQCFHIYQHSLPEFLWYRMRKIKYYLIFKDRQLKEKKFKKF